MEKISIFFTELSFQFFSQLFCQCRALAGSGNGNDQISLADNGRQDKIANLGSIGIQLGGIGGIAPERRGDLARIGLKAMFAGALASWMTAAIAGTLIG